MYGEYSRIYDAVRDLSLSKKVNALSLKFSRIEARLDELIEVHIFSMKNDGITTEDVFELAYLISCKQNLASAFVSKYEISGQFMDNSSVLEELDCILDEVFGSRESEDYLPFED